MNFLANTWSFRTVRYFGKQTDYVRQTRIITVPPEQLTKNGLTLPRTNPPGFLSSDVGLNSYNSSPPLTDASTISTAYSPQFEISVETEDKIAPDEDSKRAYVQSNGLEMPIERSIVQEGY